MAADLDNRRRTLFILGATLAGVLLCAALAAGGDLRLRLPWFFAGHGALLGLMLFVWRRVRGGGRAGWRAMLVGALLLRLVSAWGEPALSDDVYRFVWDGRMQLAGVHPYAHAPDDPTLEELRDESWERINHPELQTIYPPAAQLTFAALVALGAGPVGFRMALGLIDFGVVLALWLLLRRLSLPRDRLVFYAWNPLAIVESAGSGHLESLGVVLVVLACAWGTGRRPGAASGSALAAAIQAKLLPLALLPAFLRRTDVRGAVALVAVGMLLWLPYLLTGPAVGGGLFAYAERWDHNASVYTVLVGLAERLDLAEPLKAGIGKLQGALDGRWLPWDVLYGHVWPRDLARYACGLAAMAWLASLALRRGRLELPRECFLALAGVLILSPTVHPWYALWVLPFAAAYLSPGWLAFAAFVPLAYLGGADGVPLWARAIEYGALVAGLAWSHRRRTRLLASRA